MGDAPPSITNEDAAIDSSLFGSHALIREKLGDAKLSWSTERICGTTSALATNVSRQPALDPNHLVFIDETWAATNMARLYGRAARGLRLLAPVPHGHWKGTTLVDRWSFQTRRNRLRPFALIHPSSWLLVASNHLYPIVLRRSYSRSSQTVIPG
jgi:hypothetical protein